ncbi:MAG: hypothetical protein QG566_740 [Patescibacteria group bacterium]|nr:hypothetical protein [Patescibacteria group bacterium]
MASVAITVVLVYLFTGDSELHETISSSAFLIGGLLIARNKKLGWFINLIADTMLAYILFQNCDYLFVAFQILSITIGIRKTLTKNVIRKGLRKFWPFFIYQYIQISDLNTHRVLHSRGTLQLA